MKKALSVAYGALAYMMFLGAYLYLIAFTVNAVPNSISGPASLPLLLAAAIDLGLITIFGLQHSIMARPGFKRLWTRIVPPHLERSTYVVIGSVTVVLIVVCWQPIDGEIWNVTGAGMVALYAIAALGWLVVPVTSFLTDHFGLFGLRQVFEYALGRPKSKPMFKVRAFYRKVRHPMMLGWMAGFWATPYMTTGHLLFAGLMTSYILVAIHFEERDLAREHGPAYRAYQARVPKLVPFSKPAGAEQGAFEGMTREPQIQ